jgi:hypothetical protein
MIRRQNRASLLKGGQQNNEISYNKRTCSEDINNYCSSASNYFSNEYLSNAELFFSVVQRVEVLPVQGQRHSIRLHLSGKGEPLEIDIRSLRHYRSFQRIYFRTYAIWPPYIDIRSWGLVVQSLLDLKVEGGLA